MERARRHAVFEPLEPGPHPRRLALPFRIEYFSMVDLSRSW